MSRRAGHPVNRALRRAIAARRMERARALAQGRARRVLASMEHPDFPLREVCDLCGHSVAVSCEAMNRGAYLACDCGGGQVYACRHCMRGGFGSDPLLVDLPYCADGLAGPEWPLPGGERAALLGTVALARSLGGAR